MNIFLGQNIGRGITFKILISRTVQSRFCQILAEMLENDQSESGLFYIEWMAFWGNTESNLNWMCLKRDFVSRFSPQRRHRETWFYHWVIYHNIYCVMSESDFLISSFFKRYLALKAQNLSCYSSKASILSSKAYFTIRPSTWQSKICLVYHPAVSTREIFCLRYILGHKIASFYASEGFPSKHEGAD